MENVLPELVQNQYQRRLSHFLEKHDCDWLRQCLEKSEFQSQLATVWGCSDYVGQKCETHPEVFRQLVSSNDLFSSYDEKYYVESLKPLLPDDGDEEQLAKVLRRFRRREIMRIIWRDFTRQAPLLETTRDMTLLAEACINGALDVLYPEACASLGTPVDSSGRSQKMVVVGMGKMGAYELNVSSDIDLMFAYPAPGETQGAGRTISNQEFFIKLGQKLIRALDQQTADGFVFRVDMRLRPYGQSGALVLNFDALEEYYLTQGREWERYAMIKARIVAGEPEDIQELNDLLRPFTYRKYLDYGSIEALRDLKRAINREVLRQGVQSDIKRGPGGIREVEFIAQAFQLIRGGRDLRLQTQSLKKILDLLSADQVLAEQEAEKLWQAYVFLRNTEHAIQGIADRQTQQLPEDELGRQRIALLLGFSDWSTFYEKLEEHRQLVRQLFADVVSDTEENDAVEDDAGNELQEIWPPDEKSHHNLVEHLRSAGFDRSEQVVERLQSLLDNAAVQTMQSVSRGRLDLLMPKLLAACAARENSSITLDRVLSLIQSVLRRSAYLALLIENPGALNQLVSLCESSVWVAEELSVYPSLLDELLDPRTLYTPPDKGILQDDLRQQMLRIPSDDLEEQMEAIRYFCRSHKLRVAACELTEALPLMKVSDYLTWLAEAVVDHVIDIAWEQMVVKYGQPVNKDGSKPGFVAIGYGKVGGIELGYSSDLDLVFVHNAEANGHTDGVRNIDNSTFFTRLGQRIIHILSTHTPSGIAYEIDMRLRPSGNSGMLVTSLAAFEKYQKHDAWTWEHQALVRARVIAGDKTLGEAFQEVRHEILRQSRDQSELRSDVVEMRQKMRKHLSNDGNSGKFGLKQDHGGIVDIEFMVQFAVLAWSHDHPALTRWSDNIRILESLAQCGLLSEDEALQLTEAYKAYRSAGHRLQLQKLSADVGEEEFVEHRNMVIGQWQKIFQDQ